jgi:hypothetical protein
MSSYALTFGGASSSNKIYHNNIIDCNSGSTQASDGGTLNVWHNDYPGGGNYWSDWTTPDTQSGPNQDQTSSDGIVDNPYSIDGGSEDSYPLVNLYVILNITKIDNPTATEDLLYSEKYTAWTNIYNSTLIWSLSTNASWLSRTDSTISGTPDNSDVGSYWVFVSVTDGLNQDSTNFTLTVQNVNDWPEIITTDIEFINETEPYLVDYEANDIDPTNDILTWSLETNASFLSIDPGTGVLSGVSTKSDLGSYFVNVIVNDGKGGWEVISSMLL